MPHTLVSFHAHPDDEALLTGGTLASVAARGHRVVVVFATDGEAGLTGGSDTLGRVDLAAVRRGEADRAAGALGVARVEHLGYGDSGEDGQGGENAFARADVEQAAAHLADILRAENADVLTSYDARGGYGHPDHVQVHRVGARAAEIAGTALLLEATADRDSLGRLVRVLRHIPGVPPDLGKNAMSAAYTPRAALTHRLDVTAALPAKRAAMAAHTSQRSGGSGRTLAFLLRLPRPLFRRAMRHEWFVEPGRTPQTPLLTDVFATLAVRA